ncbi:hypothetical protein J437_LFUL002945 [Ladona fulva]|uniref:Uncharacterized protein n=1 Tax=Ladona fulva TaxID=123851 RepID=A0A8K0P3F2_LADFU|nr:hypothetical protein J437_LFUL002945 [Ladona fulva]
MTSNRPVISIPKSDGSQRLVVDYRKLNKRIFELIFIKSLWRINVRNNWLFSLLLVNNNLKASHLAL